MTSVTSTDVPGFEAHPGRGPFNAAFFSIMGPNLEWNLRRQKKRVFADLPQTVVELGSGVGANLRYLSPGSTLVALEPNPHMHRRLRAAAERRGVHLDLRERVAERTGLPDASVDTVISSLVLCTVPDPADADADTLVEGRAAHQAPEIDGSCTLALPAGAEVRVGDLVRARVIGAAGVDLETEFVAVLDRVGTPAERLAVGA